MILLQTPLFTQLIYLLVALVVIGVIAYIVKLILDSIPAPPFIRTISYLILLLVVLLVALHYFGVI